VDATITLPIGDGGEHLACQVDGAANTAHTFVFDGAFDRCASDGVLDSHHLAAVGVGVAGCAHEFEGESDGHLALGVDVGAAGSETSFIVGDVTFAGGAAAFAVG
jgi:hypothetical protein